MKADISELLSGAYDLHIHAAPSPFHRLIDEFELLRSANEARMAGILIKSHYESTAARAETANKYAGASARAYGSLALNHPVGGLNPYAVHNAAVHGARIIFMPTRDAENSLRSGDMPGDFFSRPGITVFSPEGRLKPVVYDIIDIARKYDIALATGHLSPPESIALCRAGCDAGARMLLTHPEFSRTRIPARTQLELARRGVIIEKCWYNIAEGECSAAEMARTIQTVGAEHCYLTTDRGQQHREAPAQGMRRFIAALASCGISDRQLETMLKVTPKLVLNV